MLENFENNEYIGFNLNQTASYIRIAVAKKLKEIGITDITPEQFGILFLLSEKDGLYQRQLAFLLSKDRPNISRMLDILENKKYLKREKDLNNRRISKIFITEEGRKKVEQIKPYKESFQDKIGKNISKEEMDICISVLQRIRDNLSDYCSLQI